jgi:prophage maintenance system killer protein
MDCTLLRRITNLIKKSGDDDSAMIKLFSKYSFALDLLDDFDHGRLPKVVSKPQEAKPVGPEEVRRVVSILRNRFGGGSLFGKEKDESLPASLNAVFQTAGGNDVYPSVEEKAAHLLYFLIKNHHFVDGNKRIGAAIFLWFLEKNGILTDSKGRTRIDQEALVALTLMVAESEPKEKGNMTLVTAALLEDRPR